MPSVATIESVLRLSAPVQLRVSVPVQLRVSAPVQFRLGPASQRAECREVSVPDWLPRAQSGAEQRMSVPDWLVDWLPPSAEWSRAEWIGCLSPFSPSRIGLLAPESVCPRSASFPGLAGRLAATERRVEGAESVCPRSALPRIGLLGKCLCRIGCHRAQSGAESVCPCSTSPVRPPGQDHPFGLLSPISLGKCLSQIGWSIGCRRTQSEAESVCPRSACFCCAQRLSVLNQFLQSVSPRGCLSRPSPDHPGPVSAGGVKTVELISVNCSD